MTTRWVRATEASDSINQFAAIRQVQSNAVTVSSWDFAQVSAPASELSSSLTAGELPALSIYDGVAERARHPDLVTGEDVPQLLLSCSLEIHAVQFNLSFCTLQ